MKFYRNSRVVVFAYFTVAEGIVNIPDSFNVEEDWVEKERWYSTKPFIKCSLCREIVKDLFHQPSHEEDALLDRIEAICGDKTTDKFLDSLAIKGGVNNTKYFVEKATAGRDVSKLRSALEVQWQSHAMLEVCTEQILVKDDEIGSAVRKFRKAHKKVIRKTPEFVPTSPEGLVQYNNFVATQMAKEICFAKSINICLVSKTKNAFVFDSKTDLQASYFEFLAEEEAKLDLAKRNAELEDQARKMAEKDRQKFKNDINEMSDALGESNVLKGPEDILTKTAEDFEDRVLTPEEVLEKINSKTEL